MIDVGLPEIEGASPLVRSFAACLASVTETPLDGLPAPDGGLETSVRRWRSWLAGRGAGLVEIAEPARFSWPGYWLAIVGETSGDQEGAAVLMFGTPSGVVLSPQDPGLLGTPASDLRVHRGYVVSGLDPAFIKSGAGPARLRGRVEAIAVAADATAPMRQVGEARAIAGRGLEGDRYARKAGTFTPKPGIEGNGYDLTLIEAEVLDQLALPEGRTLNYVDARRNVVTRGIRLNSLVGRRFRIGDAECVGRRLCEPCAHLERLTTPGVLRGLIHLGGLRADVVSDGLLSTGSEIETID